MYVCMYTLYKYIYMDIYTYSIYIYIIYIYIYANLPRIVRARKRFFEYPAAVAQSTQIASRHCDCTVAR